MLKLDLENNESYAKAGKRIIKKSKILRVKDYRKIGISKEKKISAKDILKYRGSCIWEGNLNDMREDR